MSNAVKGAQAIFTISRLLVLIVILRPKKAGNRVDFCVMACLFAKKS